MLIKKKKLCRKHILRLNHVSAASAIERRLTDCNGPATTTRSSSLSCRVDSHRSVGIQIIDVPSTELVAESVSYNFEYDSQHHVVLFSELSILQFSSKAEVVNQAY